MGAYPFGGHPTLYEYCQWAIREGCKVTSAVASDTDGRPTTVTIIEAPDGRKAAEIDTQMDDRLVPTSITRLDRRLGLQSPFAKLPE